MSLFFRPACPAVSAVRRNESCILASVTRLTSGRCAPAVYASSRPARTPIGADGGAERWWRWTQIQVQSCKRT